MATILLLTGCSTKKNTWSTRTYRAINTRYNVYFNGNQSYEAGLKKIATTNKEDYTTFIPMYPISKHENAKAATTDMDRAIEKSRKAIKLHSIKQKPKRNFKKSRDPKYMNFYNQNEFNPAMKDAWLLLAKAEFHKGDFLGSIGTLSYIIKHYATDKDMIVTCQLWIARAYGEMGWIYEAEDMLSKINQNDIRSSHTGLFASVNADILLKKGQYKEAIPFLVIATDKVKNRDDKLRFQYLLGQLHDYNGNKKAAFDAYSNVIKANPPYEMDFNARIHRVGLNMLSIGDTRKELNKMAKNPNNIDYLDQLYYTLGTSYLQNKDTLKAFEYFQLSIEKSTRNGVDKALTLTTLADIHYNNKNYIKAHAYYEEASKILTVENNDYARISRRAETLGELVIHHQTVVLQDSLQHLATLPESKRFEIISNLIAQLIADEEAEAKAKQEEENIQNLRAANEMGRGNMPAMIGNTGEWYFYNPGLMKSGQQDFQRKWGRRRLEDNWRRANKSATVFADATDQSTSQSEGIADMTDTSQTAQDVPETHKPEFYLRQIPVTPQQVEKSNEEIAEALYQMGFVFKDKIEDREMAIQQFETFVSRFGKDNRVPDALFQIYLLHTRSENLALAETMRTRIVNNYPDTKYAQLLSQPDYFDRLNRMYQSQDSIYNVTYAAYNASDFRTVYRNTEYIQRNYPLSTLMPKFLFLKALSIGKTEAPARFEAELSSLVEQYPTSDVSAMSKDILALMRQGMESKTGTTHGTLLSRREEISGSTGDDLIPRAYSAEKQTKHRLMLVTPANESEMNKLLYNIAAYNFSRFMVKDFDLITSKLDTTRNVLSITNFETFDETSWYLNSVQNDPTLAALFSEYKTEPVVISEDNYGLMRAGLGFSEYQQFYARQATESQKQPVATKPASTAQKAKEPIPAIKTTVADNVQSKLNELDQAAYTTAQTATTTTEADTSGQTGATTPTQATTSVTDDVPLFKNLFGYKPNEPHYIAIIVQSGNIEFDKVKAAFDKYNTENYGMLNLKTSLEKFGNQQIVLIGALTDADLAKSYLMRMVKERPLFDGMKGARYRNVLGTQKNLNVMMQQNAITTYMEFMQEYYLK